METEYVCQSCTMPMKSSSDYGTSVDGNLNVDYCKHCLRDGEFTTKESMEEMIESCIPFEIEAGIYEDADAARTSMLEIFPNLKRWARKFN